MKLTLQPCSIYDHQIHVFICCPRGIDPKLKKVATITHPKKHNSDLNGQSLSDKSFHQEQRTSITEIEKHSRGLGDETLYTERYKKKNMKQDSKEHLHKDPKSEVEFPPVAGLIFPSVKGAEGTSLCNSWNSVMFR